MTILYAWSSRCILSFKLTSSLASCYHLSPTQSSPKSNLLSKHHIITSRQLSWQGFYYSLSTSTPVLTLQNFLLDFHSYSGLPWWAVISLTTLGIRSLCVFPLAVHQNQVIGRLENMNIELKKLAPEINKEVNIAAKMYRWDESTARTFFQRSMRQYQQKFILRDNCHPFKIFLLAIFQIPVWICFSVSLRNLIMNPIFANCDAEMLQEQMKSEGLLWFKDLTVPDPVVLPIFLAVVNLALIEIHALRRIGKGSKLQTALLYIMRFAAVAVAGVAVLNPSSVTFYWLCSSTFGLAQNVILMFPKCRRVLRIPPTANESSTPFKDIATNFRKRFLP